MIRLALILAALAGAACGQLASVTPSLQYCQKVSWDRDGVDIEIRASCRAPTAPPLLH